MTSLEPEMAQKMADVARSREAVWAVMAQILSSPTRDFVEDLRTGVVRETLARNTEWVGEDNPMTIHLQSLRAFEGRSGRIGIDQDIDVLVEDWKRFKSQDYGPELVRWATGTPELCRAEADAWESDDVTTAKKVRLAQFEDLSEHLQNAVDWATIVHDDTKVLVRRMLMRIYGAHLSIESGRDVLPSIMA